MHYHCQKCSKKLTTFDVKLYQEYKKNQPLNTAVCQQCLENKSFPLSKLRTWKDQIKLFLTYWYAPLCILTLVSIILYGLNMEGVDLADYAGVFAILGIMSVGAYFYCSFITIGRFMEWRNSDSDNEVFLWFFLFPTYLIWFLPAYIVDVIYNVLQSHKTYISELIKAYKKVKSRHKRSFSITEKMWRNYIVQEEKYKAEKERIKIKYADLGEREIQRKIDEHTERHYPYIKIKGIQYYVYWVNGRDRYYLYRKNGEFYEGITTCNGDVFYSDNPRDFIDEWDIKIYVENPHLSKELFKNII